MSNELVLQIITILAPVLAAALTGGGIVAYINYKAGRPESDAKARQINVTAEISVAEAWQNYANKVEKRFNEMEDKYDKAIAIKDGEIVRLQTEVARLTQALAKYESDESKDLRKKEVEAIKVSADKLIDPLPPEL